MSHRVTPLTARMTTIALWAVGLSPAFFAVVVWDRDESPGGPTRAWGVATTQTTPTPTRPLAGDLYALGTIALLVGVILFSLANPRPPARKAGASLLAAGIAMYTGPVLSGIFGGHGGSGDWRLWLAPLAITAICVAPPIHPVDLLRRLRAILRVYTWGSLCALAVAPAWAEVPNGDVNFRLPLVGESRLLGLTNHPILLGALAAVALAMELAPLNRHRAWQLHSAAAAAVLLLTQSRTAWMAALVGVPLLYRRGAPNRLPPLLSRALSLGIVICAALLALPSLEDRIGQVMSDTEITSLHGRTEVWEVSMRAFRSNPLWGYGPSLFTDPSSPVHGMYDHAHSQLYQSLGTSGLVGAVGLLMFTAVLLAAAYRTARVSAGLSWSLVAITLVMCTTEAPLRGIGFSPYLVMVLLDIAVLVTYDRIAAEPPAATGQPFPRPAGSARSSRTAVNRLDAPGCSNTSRLGSAG